MAEASINFGTVVVVTTDKDFAVVVADALRTSGAHVGDLKVRAPDKLSDELADPACAWLWCGQAQPSAGPAIDLGNEPQAYARQLYAALYRLDRLGAQRLLIQLPPAGEAWQAVHDRLARAAQALPDSD